MKQKRKIRRKLLSFLLTLAMLIGLMPGMSMTAYAAAPSKLTFNVGENGKVVMSSGIYGNGEEILFEPTSDVDNRGTIIVADGYGIKVSEGANVNILNPGKISFYPAADNTGTITAVPADGYIFIGWYNGENLYSNNAELEYKNISEDLDLTAQFASTALTPVVSDFIYSAPSDLTYDGNAKTATVVPKEGVTGMGNVTVKYFSNPECTAELVGSPTVVGTYYVGITVTEGDNYSAVSDVLHDSNWKFTINKQAAPASLNDNQKPTANTGLTYTGNEQELVTAPTELPVGYIEMQYALGNENGATQLYTTSIPTATNAGTYYVWYKVVGDSNHLDSDAGCVTVTIATVDSSDSGSSSSSSSSSDNTNTTTDTSAKVPYDDVAISTGSVNDITGTAAATAESNPFETKIENNDNLTTLLALTPEEVSQGVNVWLDIQDMSATVPQADKDLVQNASTDLTVGMYLDINLFKKVGGNAATKITETNGTVKASILIPESLWKAGRTFEIIRVHDGVATAIEGTYDENTHIFTFETDKFSTYALAYKDSASSSNSGTTSDSNSSNSSNNTQSTSPKTGDPNDIRVWYLLLIASLGGLGFLGLLKKKKVND